MENIFRQSILVIEDDRDIQELLQNFLEEAGYKVTVAGDGQKALRLFEENTYDLILLDIMLPGLDGFTVCEKMRSKSQIPIIMLTALGSEDFQIKGLDLKVDDYITKPFSMPVLIRKIAAVLRRSVQAPEGMPESMPKGGQILSCKNLSLDLNSYTALVDGINYELTQREFEILRELLTHKGQVLTRQNLLNRLWKYDFYGDERVVDTHIKNLRKKLGIDFIRTIRGVGYKIDKEN